MSFIFFLLPFLLSIVYNIEVWDSDTLYDYTKKYYLGDNPNKNTNLQHMIIDPENYLEDADLSNINSLMGTLYKKLNIQSYIILISHIKTSHKKDLDIEKFNADIERFVSKFNYIMHRDNSFYEDNMTLTTVFFIKDRKMRMRTGRALREIIKDKDALNILNRRRNDLRQENYYSVVNKLINDVYTTYTLNYDYYNSFFYKNEEKIIFTVIFLFISIIIFISYMCYIPETDREKKIKDFLERNKYNNIKKTFNKTCVICLENFMPEEEKLKIENFLDKKKLKEEKTTFLECGHQFHEKCIVEWLKNQDKCPLCRIKIKYDKDNDKNEINRNEDERSSFISDSNSRLIDAFDDIIDIQREAYPHQLNEQQGKRIIATCNNEKNSKSFFGSWNSKSSGNDNDNDFDSFNDGSGGATSDW